MIQRLRRMGLPKLLVGVLVGLVVGGGSYAIGAQPSSSDGVHGGPKSRFHDASECNLVDVGTLEGNWTHGDYVSAVAAKDPAKVREAAHSRCGKPDHSGRGKGASKDKRKTGADDPRRGPKEPEPTPSTPAATAEPSPSPTLTEPSPEPSPTPTETTPAPEPTVSSSPTESTSPGPERTGS